MKKQGGFTYVIAMFLVAALAVIAGRAMENSQTRERRAKEAELLIVGQAYRSAIRQYYQNTPGFDKRYPTSLRALLQDERATRMTRPLRKLYRDPITGSAEWGLVEAPDGGVMGVYSLSFRQPIKIDGFTPDLADFANVKKYQDWKFVYQPS